MRDIPRDALVREVEGSWWRIEHSCRAKKTVRQEVSPWAQSCSASGLLTNVSKCLDCTVFVILPILAAGAAEPLDATQAPPPQQLDYLLAQQCCFPWRSARGGQLRETGETEDAISVCRNVACVAPRFLCVTLYRATRSKVSTAVTKVLEAVGGRYALGDDGRGP